MLRRSTDLACPSSSIQAPNPLLTVTQPSTAPAAAQREPRQRRGNPPGTAAWPRDPAGEVGGSGRGSSGSSGRAERTGRAVSEAGAAAAKGRRVRPRVRDTLPRATCGAAAAPAPPAPGAGAPLRPRRVPRAGPDPAALSRRNEQRARGQRGPAAPGSGPGAPIPGRTSWSSPAARR